MRLIITAKMGQGTFDAKIVPLSRCEFVEEILILRRNEFEKIPKTRHIKLPEICNYSFFNNLLTPVFLSYYTTKYKADLIIAYHIIPYAFIAYIAHIFTGKPFVISQTGIYIQKYAKLKIFRHILKYIINKSGFLNVPGTKSKIFWTDFGIDKNKINILHSTIDTNRFLPSDNHKMYDFIFIGRLDSNKNVEQIIISFSKIIVDIPNLKLVIVGAGPFLSYLENLSIDLNLTSNIYLTGYQSDVKEWLDKSLYFVTSSKSEGLPCSMMEAMANGNGR